MKVRLIIFAFVLSTPAWSQEAPEITVYAKNAKDSLRAHHIRSFNDHFFLWPVIKRRTLDFEMQRVPLTKNQPISYKTNKPYSFGVGMYLFELGIELAFAVPMDEEDKFLYGESDATDIQLNVLGKKWGGDIFFQKYSGFYIDDPRVKIPDGTPYPHRADIATRNFGISANYTFNHNRFSFRSAYNYVERQLKSSGSIIAFASLASFKAAGDSALLGKDYAAEFGNDSRIKEIRTTALGIAPGYTYSLIYKGFFVNGTIAAGPSHNWLAFSMEDDQQKHDIRFSLYLVARFGIGYNGDKFFGGISFMAQNHTARFETLRLNSSNNLFKILIGYRFPEFGILKKRVWDLPKELFKN